MKKWILGLSVFFSLFSVLYGETIETDWWGTGGMALSFPKTAGFKGTCEIDRDGNYAYGASLSLGRLWKNFPLELKTGKLTVNGACSLVNYPVISSLVSPFYEGQKGTRKLTSSLPSSASNSGKPDAVFSSVSLFNRKMNGAAFWNTEMDYGLSLGGVFDFGKKVSAEINFFGLYSRYESVKALDSGWYVPEGFYKEGTMFSSAFQGAFVFNESSFYFAWLLYSSPFGEFKNIFRGEISGSFGENRFCFSAFYNPCHDVLTGGKRHYDEMFQLKGNAFSVKETGKDSPVVLKYGSGFFYQAKLTEKTDTFKVNAGARISGPGAVTGLNFQGEFNLFFQENEEFSAGFTKGSVSLKTSWFPGPFQPALKADFSLEPDKTYSVWKLQEKAGFQVAFSENPSFRLNGSLCFLQENQTYEGGKITSDLSFRYKTRYISFNGKIGLSIEF